MVDRENQNPLFLFFIGWLLAIGGGLLLGAGGGVIGIFVIGLGGLLVSMSFMAILWQIYTRIGLGLARINGSVRELQGIPRRGEIGMAGKAGPTTPEGNPFGTKP